MTLLKLLKIDIKKARWNLMILVTIPLIGLAVLSERELSWSSGIFVTLYCLFGGIVVAVVPFAAENAEEAGFLEMLPVKPGLSVISHFTFSALCIMVSGGLGLLVGLIASLAGSSPSPLYPGSLNLASLYDSAFGVALLFTAIECLLLTICRYNTLQVLQLIRILPAFVFFFGSTGLLQNMETTSAIFRILNENGLVIFIICAVSFAVLAAVSRGIAVRRGR